jgi:hypothetical protein
MLNKKLSALFGVFIFFISCQGEKAPAGIIEKDKMIGIFVDMHISDSYLYQIQNTDTMLMQAKSRYNYIFKKHAIDSAKFSNSLNYYSLNPKELDEMYQKVVDSLEGLEKSLKPKPKVLRKPKPKPKAKKVK